MASASTPSGNEPVKNLVLVHTVQLVSSGIRYVAFASVHSKKTCLKKLIKLRPEN